MSQDKIAEHIAKFKIGDEVVLTSVDSEDIEKGFNIGDTLIIHRFVNPTRDLKGIRVNDDFFRFDQIEPKQEKGEIMKSIELSEYTIKAILRCIERGTINKLMLNGTSEIVEVFTTLRLALQNAKPIEPIVQKWSEEEERAIYKACNYYGSHFSCSKVRTIAQKLTPKLVMRDRTTDELADWISSDDTIYFSKARVRAHESSVNFSISFLLNPVVEHKFVEYQKETGSDWLPIPQIEKEK